MKKRDDSISVLLIDDSETSRLVGRSLLQQLGHRVETALNGNEALSLLEKKGYPLIFMDLHMDGMDGDECSRQIRERYRDGDHYIVALTASSSEEELQSLYSSGIDDYVQKPMTASHLKEVLARMMERKGCRKEKRERVEPLPQELSFEGDKELMNKFIGSFLSNYPSLLEKIERAIEGKRRVELALSLHKLLGLCGYLGNEKLDKLLKEIESLSEKGAFVRIEALFLEVKTLLKEIEGELSR